MHSFPSTGNTQRNRKNLQPNRARTTGMDFGSRASKSPQLTPGCIPWARHCTKQTTSRPRPSTPFPKKLCLIRAPAESSGPKPCGLSRRIKADPICTHSGPQRQSPATLAQCLQGPAVLIVIRDTAVVNVYFLLSRWLYLLSVRPAKPLVSQNLESSSRESGRYR